MHGQDALLQEIIRLKREELGVFLRHYVEHELFSIAWWISLAMFAVPLVVLWKMADRRRLLEILVFGLLVNVAASFLDVFGYDYVLWEYPVHLLPMNGLLFPVDYVIVPVVGMLIYQRYAKWKPFLLACAIASAIMSFVCEPIAVFLGIYMLTGWHYIYSFPIYILIYVAARLSVRKMASMQEKAEKTRK